MTTKTSDLVDVLSGAEALISRPSGWARGIAVQRRYPDSGETVYAYCATAAVDVVLGFRAEGAGGRLLRLNLSPEARNELRKQAVQALFECVPTARRENLAYGGYSERSVVERFNDSSEKDEVLAMYQCAVDKAKKDRKPVTGWKRWTAWRW